MSTKFVKLKRYIMSRGSTICIIVLCLISLGAYSVLNTNQYISNELVNGILTNIFLVITSITGTNLLTSVILETNNKNQEWRHFISKDVLSNSINEQI